MNNFQLSEQADPNKIFLTKFSELEGRFDPNTYHPIRRNAINKIINSKFNYQILRELSDFSKKTTKHIDNNVYIGLENIESNTGIFIKSKERENISSAIVFKKGQVLFPKLRPYLNKVHYANFDGICSTEFHVLDSEYLNNKFLAYFLSLEIVVKQTTLLMSGNTLPRLQTEDIKNLLIPIPSEKIQADIVEKMDKAYQDKKDKETQVQKLLDSIDKYLLDELGIDFPKQTDNSLKARIFTKKFSEVAGGRLDPDYHKPIYSVIDSALNNSKYEITNLDNISNNIFQGVGRNLTENTMHILLKVKNIAKNNEIRFDDVEYIDLYNNNKIKILKSGDIISPFIGEAIKQYKFSVFPELSKKYTVDNNTGVIRLFECANPIFISAFLMSFYGRKQIDRQLGGGGVPFIGTNGIKQLKIPLPPLEKQNQIAKRISKIRDQAKQLQTEAKNGLEQAKHEVEIMILKR
ncbi:Type I restriction-modification system, DNA-methyltransferase subunit M / Type I restriction-modification system, specificity subunit S [uncultured Candidatus Thioglobus sp.]|nr:Type I restriction-modification system, DNA-methyltransferase subunit M / Type I restriction-modification system, specificity subunit S [uncultured Candidatus Thioglobus sp.]